LISKTEGRLVSEELGLHLEDVEGQLRFYDPQRGVYLPTPEEIREAWERESAARAATEAQAQREATARAAAEAQFQHEAAARAAADTEVERLRREIEALRSGAPPSPRMLGDWSQLPQRSALDVWPIERVVRAGFARPADQRFTSSWAANGSGWSAESEGERSGSFASSSRRISSST
jgi:hypothetical protein